VCKVLQSLLRDLRASPRSTIHILQLFAVLSLFLALWAGPERNDNQTRYVENSIDLADEAQIRLTWNLVPLWVGLAGLT
jgi:hypothetical protein